MSKRLYPASLRCRAGVLAPLALVAGSALAQPVAPPGASGFQEQLVWALNVGGGEYASAFGERYRADDCDAGEGRCGVLPRVTRTQSPGLFETYRLGDQRYREAVPPGAYDVVLYFVEPSADDGWERRFDVRIEGETVLENFNLLEIKNGQTAAAVTRAIPSRTVSDGVLDIELVGRSAEPVLAGIQVRRSGFSTAGWELVWADEFDAARLDRDSWTIVEWPARFVNDEDQAYTAASENGRLEEGRLIIEAHATGAQAPAFTSGRIHSAGKRYLRYGRVDVRARVPEGRGVWPALWFLPEDPFRYATTCDASIAEWQGNAACDAWPNSGEIDLMEHVGNQPGIVHGTVHTRDYFGGLGTQIGEAVYLPGLGRDFQVYSLVWEAGRLAMYVDGHRFFAYRKLAGDSGQWPFDHPFHLVMNLAVGGTWGRENGGIDRDAFPRRLEIDYVRFFQPQHDQPEELK